jgi:cyclophilin family peptidyl-prolyl cis-trans isomerase
MIAAKPETEGKSSGDRFYVNVNDGAAQSDGTRVIFGRVISGLDVVKQIVLDTPFSTENERRFGTGRPRDDIVIESVTIQEK